MKLKPHLQKRIALNVFSKFADVQAELHELNFLGWECTLRCNINCQHCGSDCSKSAAFEDMPAEDFLKVTARIKEQYDPGKITVGLTGGEPLMRKDLEEIGRELKKQGYPWGIVTNGYALTENRFQSLIDSGLRSMTVSLDGMEENHNWLRGNDQSFKRAVNAIKMAIAEDSIKFDVVTCVSLKNLNELQSIKEFLYGLGLKNWRIFDIDPIGRAAEGAEFQFSGKDYIQLMDTITAIRKENKIKTQYSCHNFLGNYENRVREGYSFCSTGINISTILVDGSITGCANMDKGFVQGNIYNDDFLDVWNNRFKRLETKAGQNVGSVRGLQRIQMVQRKCHALAKPRIRRNCSLPLQDDGESRLLIYLLTLFLSNQKE